MIKAKCKLIELRLTAVLHHIRILARDPPTTKSEDFSLLCYPAWGGSPFLSDLDTLPYEKLPMSTPGLRWTRHPHPGNSDTTPHTTALTTHCPARSLLLQVDATQPGTHHIKKQTINTRHLVPTSRTTAHTLFN